MQKKIRGNYTYPRLAGWWFISYGSSTIKKSEARHWPVLSWRTILYCTLEQSWKDHWQPSEKVNCKCEPE